MSYQNAKSTKMKWAKQLSNNRRKMVCANEWNFSQFICIRMECLKRFPLCMTKRRSDIKSFIVVFWLFRWMLNEFSKRSNINAPSQHSKTVRCTMRVVTAFIINSRFSYSLHNYINRDAYTFHRLTDWMIVNFQQA